MQDESTNKNQHCKLREPDSFTASLGVEQIFAFASDTLIAEVSDVSVFSTFVYGKVFSIQKLPLIHVFCTQIYHLISTILHSFPKITFF